MAHAVTFACPRCGTIGISFFGMIVPDCRCRFPRYTRMIPIGKFPLMIPLGKFPLMVVMRDE